LPILSLAHKSEAFVRRRLHSFAVLANLRLLSKAEQAYKTFGFVSVGFVRNGCKSTGYFSEAKVSLATSRCHKLGHVVTLRSNILDLQAKLCVQNRRFCKRGCLLSRRLSISFDLLAQPCCTMLRWLRHLSRLAKRILFVEAYNFYHKVLYLSYILSSLCKT
jgi:hypothetical protein